MLKQAAERPGATVFAYPVKDPERYGVVEFDSDKKAISLEEKPARPRSNNAVTGLYFFDSDVVQITRNLKPSARGELEILDTVRPYMERGTLHVQELGRGFAWLDTGTHESLLQAGNFVSTLQDRQGMQIACVEEIAYRKGFISLEQLATLAENLGKSTYATQLKHFIRLQNA
jgi:glucose-1-phosphate thymidylyltransferase